MDHVRSGLVAVAVGAAVWLAVSLTTDTPTRYVLSTAGVPAIVAAAVAYVLTTVLKRRRSQGPRSSGRRGRPSRGR